MTDYTGQLTVDSIVEGMEPVATAQRERELRPCAPEIAGELIVGSVRAPQRPTRLQGFLNDPPEDERSCCGDAHCIQS